MENSEEKILFDEIPDPEESEWQKCKIEKDFMPIAFEVFKFLGISIGKIVYTIESTTSFKEKQKDLKFLIIQAHLMKTARMMNSVLHLAGERKFLETLMIIQRVLCETIVNARWLIHFGDEKIFNKYLDCSLSPEKELWNNIEENIKKRGGKQENIETSMKESINRACRLAGKKVEDIPTGYNKWGPSTYKKLEDLKLSALFNPIYSLGSHAIHTSFVDLIQFFLKEEDDFLVLKETSNYPKDAHLVSLGIMAVHFVYDYIEIAFSEKETKDSMKYYFEGYLEQLVRINKESIEANHGSLPKM
ncbi:hypothetical protein BIY24_05430 [Halobacteriovorax marinus]|uniref:DUF5677 domain-containing protein n=1 Tax=Halobacteriovorax marinus TaxID=97084 RepID=UPI000BC32B74|nr:DUF5677 domain-containing protein [Halobacteriovorax marinus]ATH07399.1 hypothetical protein BIY24_05430 [Halobacteriovorax marinus]